MQARDPAPPQSRIRWADGRPPTPLPPWVMLALALHCGFFSTYSVTMGALPQAIEVLPFAALRWGLLTFLLCLPLLGWGPVLHHLDRWGGVLTRPRLVSWSVYYGVLVLLAFAGAWLRSVLAPWALGFALEAQTFWQFVALLFSALLISAVGIEAFASRRRARLEWLALSERLERDQERRRFDLVALDDRLRREAAQHLHGDVQSRLLMAWALLKHAQDAPDEAIAKGHLDRVREQLEQLQGQGVPHARDLLGASETDRPFSRRVTELVERFRAVIPVELVVEPTVSAREADLVATLQRQAHLLLEEALINAFRHGKASHIRVHLAVVGAFDGGVTSALRLTVEDDGVGFDPERPARGLGLSALSDELAQAGGIVELASRPSLGTRLTLQLPLQAAVAERRP